MVKKTNSTLGVLAILFSIFGCTFIVGAILAVIDLRRKDGRKKSLSVLALVICFLWASVFISGKFRRRNRESKKNDAITTEAANNDERNTPDIEEWKATEAATETVTEEVIDETSDEYVINYERKSPDRDGFELENNESVVYGGYTFSIPKYFKDKTTSENKAKLYTVTEKENEVVRFEIAVTDADVSNGDSLSSDDIDDLVVDFKFITHDYKETTISNSKTYIIDGKFKSVETEKTYIGDGVIYIIIDETNSKMVMVVLRQTFGTNFDYRGDVQKICENIVFSGEETGEESGEETGKGNGVSDDFKEFLDSYEEFMDEYIEFMGLYNANPTDAELMSQYLEIMTKYASFTTKLAALDESEMTDEEAAYYLEVTTRVTQKLIEAGMSN